jgi:hypothetical protein
MKKTVALLIVALIGNLYLTFVLQNLWNWFVSEAFHVSQISFWVLYGLVLMVRTFVTEERPEEQRKFRSLEIAIDACIPRDKREFVEKHLQEQKEAVWAEAGIAAFSDFIGNTISLGIGWGVHIFLV